MLIVCYYDSIVLFYSIFIQRLFSFKIDLISTIQIIMFICRLDDFVSIKMLIKLEYCFVYSGPGFKKRRKN